ncbi:MAG: 1-deoxy-D-xylulose-5-phosphate reductoisomerase [Bacillaceae bacterium]|nr:1-deoxy-D-xylulose-5-phosphate reductoisomerase [Bacillaceae bacterium]
MKKKIAILGSTGSIGTSTLDVVSKHPDHFEVVALAGGYNVELIVEQAIKYNVKAVSLANRELAEKARFQLSSDVKVFYGEEGLSEIATRPEADFVVTAVVGSQGLKPTLAAIEAGKTIGLANKETLVSGGHIVMERARQKGVPILPIDSEHSAIFQCLQGEEHHPARRIVLTASGGAFRDKTRDALKQVSVEEALKHPTWNMGAKVTIDSATMMNKGLEVIEAHWLFDMPFSKIDCLIHYESIIHSMVEFEDSAVMAQLGTPDMRVPILYALHYPQRLPLDVERLDLARIGQLTFKEVDFDRYRMLKLAYQAGETGGTMPTVLNAANEVLVDKFLNKQISFLDIECMLASVLDQHKNIENPELEAIFEADRWARTTASNMI